MVDESERRRIMAARNKMMAFVLLGFVVLFFAITIAKRSGHSAAETKAALTGAQAASVAH